jgi:hypothetical protein
MLSKIDIDDAEARRLYRAVLMDAVSDIGYGTPQDRSRVFRWMLGDTFGHCCTLAGWSEDWAKDVMRSLGEIDEPMRRRIVRDCLKMLRSVTRITGAPSGKALHISVAPGTLSEGTDMKYIAAPSGKMHKASKEMHSRRSDESND